MRAIFYAMTAVFGLTGAAQAELKICNDTRVLQSVALGFKSETDWASKGWWNIEPGECATVVSGDLTKRYYYYFADADGGGFRGQNFQFCIKDVVFEIEGDTDCEQRGFMADNFREIDTGETATSFTLTLVTNSGSAGGNTAKAPGGGGETGGELGTQTVTEVAETPEITVDLAALNSDLPEGRHGEPFTMFGVFQGCELDQGRAFCSFHSGGIKYRAFYNGPTPEEMMYALEEMNVTMPIEVTGDMAETRGLQRAVVLRSVQPRPGGDPFARMRKALQGDWVDERDRHSEMTILGSEAYTRYRGAFKTTRFLDVAEKCDGLRGRGPVLLQKTKGENLAKCYRISQSRSRLELIPVRGGDTLRFRRQ